MRELTFRGFMKQYVTCLSFAHTSAVSQLVGEAATSNPRLREPLLLYAMVNDRLQALLTASEGTPCASFFHAYLQRFSKDELLQKLENGDTELPHEFHKVWLSYQAEKMKPAHEASMKGLYRTRILDLKETCSVSTYRLCKDLKLNNANVCTWLRTGEPRLVTVDTARRMCRYLEKI